eukprot:TRINITY_DN930_c0_g1_i1.p1 TRINITY_DN930_c0_g1~~TRINITY_DN930_c0_g1_i1.p1  ORF type:complete len:579 (+),score=71.37 TRINITY_DN930_c0_g1_i1:101-1837(+)
MTTQQQKNNKLSDLPKDHPLFQAAPTENAKRLVVTKPGLNDVGPDTESQAKKAHTSQKASATSDNTGSSTTTVGAKDATSTVKGNGPEKTEGKSVGGSTESSGRGDNGSKTGRNVASGKGAARKRSRSAQNSAFQSMIQHMRYSHHSFVSQFDTVCAKYGKGGKTTPGSPSASPATKKGKRGSAVSAPVTFISDETGLPRHKRAKVTPGARSAMLPTRRDGVHSTSPYIVSPPVHPAMSPYDLHMHRAGMGGDASTSPWVSNTPGSMAPPPPSSTPHRPGTKSAEIMPGQQHSPYIRNQGDQYHYVNVYGQPGYGPINHQGMPSPAYSTVSAPPVLHHASNSSGSAVPWNTAPGPGHPSPYTTSTQGHAVSTDGGVTGFNSAVAPPPSGYTPQGPNATTTATSATSAYTAGAPGTTVSLGPGQQVQVSQSQVGHTAYTGQQGSAYGHYAGAATSSQLEHKPPQPPQAPQPPPPQQQAGQHPPFQAGPGSQAQAQQQQHQQPQQQQHQQGQQGQQQQQQQQFSVQGGQVPYPPNPSLTPGYVPAHGYVPSGYATPGGGYNAQGSYPAPQPLSGASSSNI